MSNIEIDNNKWVTQKECARVKSVTVQAVNNWIRRNKIEFKKIKELNITLVNPDTLIEDQRKNN